MDSQRSVSKRPVVGIIAPEYPPSKGGMERYAFEIAIGLHARGFQVVVFTRKRETVIANDIFPVIQELIGVWAIDEQIISQWDTRVDIWHVMNAAWSWLAIHHEHIIISIHGNDFLNPNAIGGFGLRRRLRLPFGSRLDYYIAKLRTPMVMRRAFPRASHIISNSKYTEGLFLLRNPKCHGKTSVGYVGVSKLFFSRPICNQTNLTHVQLVSVCRLSEPRKNIDVVLHALAVLMNQYSFTYTIVGDGALRPTLQALAIKLGLIDKVVFTGSVPDDELVNHLSESDLFILTSTCSAKNVEGFGIVYLEANACGTPVLALHSGGAVEAVHEGISGMFVDEPTVPKIVESLTQYFNGEVSFDRHACRKFARQFTWDKVVEHISLCYTSVLNDLR